MHRLLALLASAAALVTLPGCLLLLANSDPSCPNDGMTSSGAVELGAEERSPVLTNVDLDADPTGSCIHAVSLSLNFGQGCSMWVQADGPMDAMAVYDVSIFDEEGCGFPEAGFRVQDYGASTVSVDGRFFGVGGDDSVCFDGTVTVQFDLVFEENGVEVPVSGSVQGEGVELAWFEPGNCP